MSKHKDENKNDVELCFNTIGFVDSYLLLFVAGVLILTLTARCGLGKALSEFVSVLGTVGVAIGLTGSATNNATLIVEVVGMILGRLEIFIVLTGAYYGLREIKVSWRKFR